MSDLQIEVFRNDQITLDQIRAMTRELMTAHAQYIPVLAGRLPADRKIMYTEKQAEKEAHVDPGEADKF